MAYSKVLVAKNSPKNECYANDGEWLIVGQSEDHMRGSLPQDHHFFVGVDSHEPSRYGWVREIDHEIEPEDLAVKYSSNPSADLVASCRLLLDAVRTQTNDTPMACTYSNVGVLRKIRTPRVHKVFFYHEKQTEAGP